MNTIGSLRAAVLFLGTNLLLGALPVRAGEEAEMGGEPLTPDACGPSYVETLDDAVARTSRPGRRRTTRIGGDGRACG